MSLFHDFLLIKAGMVELLNAPTLGKTRHRSIGRVEVFGRRKASDAEGDGRIRGDVVLWEQAKPVGIGELLRRGLGQHGLAIEKYDAAPRAAMRPSSIVKPRHGRRSRQFIQRTNPNAARWSVTCGACGAERTMILPSSLAKPRCGRRSREIQRANPSAARFSAQTQGMP